MSITPKKQRISTYAIFLRALNSTNPCHRSKYRQTHELAVMNSPPYTSSNAEKCTNSPLWIRPTRAHKFILKRQLCLSWHYTLPFVTTRVGYNTSQINHHPKYLPLVSCYLLKKEPSKKYQRNEKQNENNRRCDVYTILGAHPNNWT